MVDRNNLQQVNMLYAEASMIESALQGFDNGGRIVEMSVSPGPLPEGADVIMRPSGIPVSTVHIDYPPQMVDAIRQQLAARHDAIESELRALGLS